MDYRAVGFAVVVVVVVAADGILVAFGKGCLPEWCTTAAAVEAWALVFTLSIKSFAPRIRNDCQALLIAAWGSVERAVAASRPRARIWTRITACVDVDLGAVCCGMRGWC